MDPATWLKVRRLAGWPSNRIDPVVRPVLFLCASTSKSVVFPAPAEPINAVIVPGLAKPLTQFSNVKLKRPCSPGRSTYSVKKKKKRRVSQTTTRYSIKPTQSYSIRLVG